MYIYHRKVWYHETDKMGIAHHANYVRWMEEARVEWLDSIGAPFVDVEREGIASPVVGVEVEYKKPCTFGDELAIEVAVAEYTGVRLEVRYRMTNAATGELVATARSKHCFLKDGRPTSLKRAGERFHEALERARQTDAE